MKVCSKCNIGKDESHFKKDNRRKGGLSSWCKMCHNKQHQLYKVNNRDKVNEYGRVYYSRVMPEETKVARVIYQQLKALCFREKYLAKKREYAARNKKKEIDRATKWKKNNLKRFHENARKNYKKSADELRDNYVKNLLRNNGVSTDYIKNNPLLIDVKKTIIQIKRKLKNHVKETKKADKQPAGTSLQTR